MKSLAHGRPEVGSQDLNLQLADTAILSSVTIRLSAGSCLSLCQGLGSQRAVENDLESHTDHFAVDTAQVLQGAGEKPASARKPSQGRLTAVARGLESGW